MAPSYPGYKQPCNGCGQCCLFRPCPIAKQFNLGRNGKCKALKFRAGRYWCDVITKPRMVSVQLAKLPRKYLRSAIGVDTYCDAKKKETT